MPFIVHNIDLFSLPLSSIVMDLNIIWIFSIYASFDSTMPRSVRQQYMNLGYLLVVNIGKVNTNPVIAEVLMRWKFNQRCTRTHSALDMELRNSLYTCGIKNGKHQVDSARMPWWALTYDTTSKRHLNRVTLIERQTAIYHKSNEPKVNRSNWCFKLINCLHECGRVSHSLECTSK